MCGVHVRVQSDVHHLFWTRRCAILYPDIQRPLVLWTDIRRRKKTRVLKMCFAFYATGYWTSDGEVLIELAEDCIVHVGAKFEVIGMSVA